MRYQIRDNGPIEGVELITFDSDDFKVATATFQGYNALADAEAMLRTLDPQPLARAALERKQLMAAINEIFQAGHRLSAIAQVADFSVVRSKFGEVVALLDNACARIHRLGTDRPFTISGLNPMEETCRALDWYGRGGADNGERARGVLEEYGVPFAHVKRGD